MSKEVKTNAMRILDKNHISYELLQYECDEFIDGLHTAEKTGAPVEQSFKTLVAQGKSRQYYVLVLPVSKTNELAAEFPRRQHESQQESGNIQSEFGEFSSIVSLRLCAADK